MELMTHNLNLKNQHRNNSQCYVVGTQNKLYNPLMHGKFTFFVESLKKKKTSNGYNFLNIDARELVGAQTFTSSAQKCHKNLQKFKALWRWH